jgi:hypothetical protein
MLVKVKNDFGDIIETNIEINEKHSSLMTYVYDLINIFENQSESEDDRLISIGKNSVDIFIDVIKSITNDESDIFAEKNINKNIYYLLRAKLTNDLSIIDNHLTNIKYNFNYDRKKDYKWFQINYKNHFVEMYNSYDDLLFNILINLSDLNIIKKILTFDTWKILCENDRIAMQHLYNNNSYINDLGQMYEMKYFDSTNACDEDSYYGIISFKYESKINNNYKCISYVCNQPLGLIKYAISSYPKSIKYLSHVNADMHLTLVKINGNVLEYIEEQNEELCMNAIDENDYAFNYINPKLKTKKFIKKIIDKHPICIRYVNNPSKKLCMSVLRKNGLLLEYIKNKSYDLCVIAIENDPNAIKIICDSHNQGYLTQDQINKLCMIAIESDACTLEYIENQTIEMCLKAVELDYYAFNYVKNKTIDICMKAIGFYTDVLNHISFLVKHGSDIEKEFIKKNKYDIYMKALDYSHHALEYVDISNIYDHKTFEKYTYILCLKAVKKDGDALKYIHELQKKKSIAYLSNEKIYNIYITAIDNNPCSIRHVKEQTDELCLRAVRQNGEALKYIDKDKKTEILYMEAINEKSSHSLYYIEDDEITYDMCVKAVTIDGYNLKYVPEDKITNELCLIAIDSYTYAIEFIPDNRITYDMCMKAVEKCGLILSHIYHRTPTQHFLTYELYLKAVKNDGHAIQFIPNDLLTYEICIEAVKNDGYAIQFIPNDLLTYEICIEAVKNNGHAIEFIPNDLLNYSLCLEAVKNNGYAIEFIPNNLLSYDICIEASKTNKHAINYVKDKNTMKEIIRNDPLCLLYTVDDYTHDINYPIEELSYALVKYAENKYLIDVNNDSINRSLRYIYNNLCQTILRYNGMTLQYINKQTEEMCIIAVKENYKALQFVKNKTYKICENALMNNYSAIKYCDKYKDIFITNNKKIHYNKLNQKINKKKSKKKNIQSLLNDILLDILA